MYAGVEEAEGGADGPGGGIPYTGFKGSAWKNLKRKAEKILLIIL